MKHYTNLNQLALEIYERENVKGRYIRPLEVKRVIKHLCDILGEEWNRNYGLTLMATLCKAGMRSIRRKNNDK